MSRDLLLSEGGKWIPIGFCMCVGGCEWVSVFCMRVRFVCNRCFIRFPGSSFLSHNVFPDSFRFLKAIRHCRICQLRSSKRFWDCGKHRKLYKNISSYFISVESPCSILFPRRFSKSTLEPPPHPPLPFPPSFLIFRVWRSDSSSI